MPLGLASAASLVVFLLLAAPPVRAAEPGDELKDFISVYGGVNFEERIAEFFGQASATFQRSFIGAVAYTHPWARTKRARWELEGQIVRHGGLQNLWELNVSPVVRLMDTPWDHVIDTRFAVGWGLSWASEEPPIEPRQEEEVGTGDSSQLLSYNVLEMEFKPASTPNMSGFLRMHHRSGVFGLFGGVEGGSNFLGGGVRWYF